MTENEYHLLVYIFTEEVNIPNFIGLFEGYDVIPFRRRGMFNNSNNSDGLSIDLGSFDHLPEQELDNILQFLSQKLINVPNYNMEISIPVYITPNNRPALSFTKKQIDLMSKLKASLDIDLYVLPDDSQDEGGEA